MRELYLAVKMLWKQKLANLLIMIITVSSIAYLMPLFEGVVHYRESTEALEALEMENGYYLYMNPYYSRKNSEWRDSLERQIENTGYIAGRAEIFYLADEKENYNICVYNHVLCQKFHPELKSGEWIEEEKDGMISVIVTEDLGYLCGDIFEITISSSYQTRIFVCKVNGVIKTTAKIPAFSSSADDKYFTSDAIVSNISSAVLLPMTEEIEELIREEKYMISSGGSILYTNKNVSYQEVVDDFGYAGIVTDLSRGQNRFYEQTKSSCIAIGVYFLFYFLITIICLLCNTILLSIRSEKMYTIYFINGMSIKMYWRIELFRMGIFALFATIFSSVWIFKIGYLRDILVLLPKTAVVFAIFIYVSIIFLPAFWFLKIRNKKTDFVTAVQKLGIE